MRENNSRLALFLALFILFSVSTPAFAVKQFYVVYMGVHSHGQEDDISSINKVKDSHMEFLSSFLGSSQKAQEAIVTSYTRDINGFAAILDEDQAAAIAKHPSVVSVFLNKGKHLQTTHSWDFMLLEKNGVIPTHSLWKQANFGEDIIIANLDTGVWPESQSFSDEGYGEVPSKWKGFCESNTAEGVGVPCNRKLIGARYFNKAYAAGGGEINVTTSTARDYLGHGSHTLSTAGGNFVSGANMLGHLNGTAKGGSPRARVASYKVCWPPLPGNTGTCFEADILDAFDAAIRDGVDVISVSLAGSPIDYFDDGIAIGAFHAVRKGAVVVCSAGNQGPTDGTVSNVAPWIITVGASTMDRHFINYVELRNGKRFKGSSISGSTPGDTFRPLITGAQAKARNVSAADAMLCKNGTLDHSKVRGKILVCLRGETARVDKSLQAGLAGAVSLILCNDEADGDEIVADTYFIPSSHINYLDGLSVFDYVNFTKNPMGYVTASSVQLNAKPAPVMASFSSKGPNSVTQEILKPDITGPGVDVMAAYTGVRSPTELDFDIRRTPYTLMSGTSMSCPHISGVVGLLKKIHPDWSPAAIKSAIMTTARTRDNTVNPMLDGSYVEATPFDYGAGHIQPRRAADPGLIYDLSTSDYLDFLCAHGYSETMLKTFFPLPHRCPTTSSNATLMNFNYPSITIPNLFVGSLTITRKVKNVGSSAFSIYSARIQEPQGFSISVKPIILEFDSIGEVKTFKLTVTNTHNKSIGQGLATDYVFGELLWSDGHHHVRSPIVIGSATSYYRYQN